MYFAADVLTLLLPVFIKLPPGYFGFHFGFHGRVPSEKRPHSLIPYFLLILLSFYLVMLALLTDLNLQHCANIAV
jgi:hypothetical protein